MNALTGAKVAIVSDKPHTTRHRIRGVHTTDDAQLILVDLPGWQRPVDPLTERMQVTVNEGIADDVDMILFVLNARERIGAGDRYVARRIFPLGVPVVIVVNKIDRLKMGHIASQMKRQRRSATSTRSTRSAPRPATASTSCAPTSSRCFPRARSTTRPRPTPTWRSRRASPSSSASRRCTC